LGESWKRPEFSRVLADGLVEIETIMLVEGTIRERKSIAWPVVSKKKSIDLAGITSVGLCLV
jgi:hypothetical protein